MITVTRQQFIEAIEVGLRACPGMWDVHVERLRSLGRNAAFSVVGANSYDAHKCPIHQTALNHAGFFEEFACAYDDYMIENYTHLGSTAIRIED